MNPLSKLSRHSAVPLKSDIQKWARELKKVRDSLAEASSQDTGRSFTESLLVDWLAVESALHFLQRSIDQVFEAQALQSGLSSMLNGPRRLMQRRIPLGEVLIVGTWNYPLTLHLVQILFALAAGNRVTFKASPFTPHLKEVFEKKLVRIFGSENFKVWNPEPEACLESIRKGNFQLVMFTGGTGAAKIFAKACAEAMIPFLPEASGSEVAVVMKSFSTSEKDEHMDHLLWATFHFSGQTCVAPRFWFVPSSEIGLYWERAQRELSNNPQALESRAPLRNENVRREHKAWEEWMLSTGAQIFRPALREEFSIFKAKTLEGFPTLSPPTFGPSAVLIPYNSVSDVVQWIKDSPWSLLTTVLGDVDSNSVLELQKIETSIVSFGEAVVSCSDAAVPFGGRGLSGYGSCHGLEGLHHLSRSQTWIEVNTWPGLSKIRPSWKRLLSLNEAGKVLINLKDRPLETGWNWISNRFVETEKKS